MGLRHTLAPVDQREQLLISLQLGKCFVINILLFHQLHTKSIRYLLLNLTCLLLSFICLVLVTPSMGSNPYLDVSKVYSWSYLVKTSKVMKALNLTNIQIILGYCPSLVFWYFINTTAYHLGHCKPSSPSTKELHGLSTYRFCLEEVLIRALGKS